MSENQLIVACASYIVINRIINRRKEEKKRKQRLVWMSDLYLSRNRYDGTNLLADLNDTFFKNFTRMSREDFSILLEMIKPKIVKRNTYFREAIPPEVRLAICLRFLASGDSYTSLQYTFKVSRQLITRIVPEVCTALCGVLKDFIRLPDSAEEWMRVSKEYEDKWNFPNCVGSMDGKHVMIQSPFNSGSEYYNYKSFFSVVLLALVDADYNFLYVDCGCQGRISDGGVFKNSKMYNLIETNRLNLPVPRSLQEGHSEVPYVFLADEAFPLMDNIMKPYAGIAPKGSRERIYNYRLSRARRVIENVFGIISSAFRILRRPMLLQPDQVKLIVMTITYLHNFLRKSKTSREVYSPTGSFDTEIDGIFLEGSWRQDGVNSSFTDLKNIPRKSKKTARDSREEFTMFFQNNPLPWQDNY